VGRLLPQEKLHRYLHHLLRFAKNKEAFNKMAYDVQRYNYHSLKTSTSVGRSESDVKISDSSETDQELSDGRYRTWPCSESTHACVISSIDAMFRLANK
jgi:hypothetical protein